MGREELPRQGGFRFCHTTASADVRETLEQKKLAPSEPFVSIESVFVGSSSLESHSSSLSLPPTPAWLCSLNGMSYTDGCVNSQQLNARMERHTLFVQVLFSRQHGSSSLLLLSLFKDLLNSFLHISAVGSASWKCDSSRPSDRPRPQSRRTIEGGPGITISIPWLPLRLRLGESSFLLRQL